MTIHRPTPRPLLLLAALLGCGPIKDPSATETAAAVPEQDAETCTCEDLAARVTELEERQAEFEALLPVVAELQGRQANTQAELDATQANVRTLMEAELPRRVTTLEVFYVVLAGRVEDMEGGVDDLARRVGDLEARW